MKRILLFIIAAGMLLGAISCKDDEPGKGGDGQFNVNTPMINHLYNTVTGEVMGMANTHNRLMLDTLNHKASLELNYNDGSSNKTLRLTDVTARAKRLGFYELTSASEPTFSGYVDFNESAMRYSYTTAEGIRVISTIPDVYYLKTRNVITYDDTTKATTMDNVMYQFTLSPATSSAMVKVMAIVHAKDLKFFYNITAASAPVTVTRDGYVIAGNNITTSAVYRSWTDSVGQPTIKTSDKYPFKTFNAVADLEHDSIHATFMMGGSASVTATGTTYPNYTSY